MAVTRMASVFPMTTGAYGENRGAFEGLEIDCETSSHGSAGDWR